MAKPAVFCFTRRLHANPSSAPDYPIALCPSQKLSDNKFALA
jgi:hypothetical protein